MPKAIVLASLLVTVVVGALGRPQAYSAAECTRPTGDSLRQEESVEFVFDGTAIEHTRLTNRLIRSTVHVHRVWKGPVTQRFVVYGRGEVPEASLALIRGTRYIVAASQDAPDDLPQGGVFTLPCAAIAYEYARELVLELGRGRVPAK